MQAEIRFPPRHHSNVHPSHWSCKGNVATYKAELEAVEGCLATQLCALRNPVQAWTSLQLHWLDRIASVGKHLGRTASVEW